MFRAVFACLALCACAQPARAQTRIYVTGDVFAEIARFSRATTSPEILAVVQDASPGDGVTIGGGGRIGAFFTPSWSLELGLDIGRTISEERTQSIRQLIGAIFPPFPPAPLQYQSRTSHRFSASSVLLGYHPPARGRIQAGFRGGVSFRQTERTFTTANTSFSFSSLPTLPGGFPVVVDPRISVVTAEYTTVSNGLTATLAAETAINVSDSFAIVPEIRAHAGGTGAFFLRPGIAVRWRW
jgi:hypothetical protein